MEFLYITIPITLFLAGLGLLAFIWLARSGQFHDVEGPKYRMLYDEDESHPKPGDKA